MLPSGVEVITKSTVINVNGRVSGEVMTGRLRLAERTRDELAAAGLPVVPPTVDACLDHPGAEVVPHLTTYSFAPVTIEWRTSPPLHDVFRRAALAARVDAPEFRHHQQLIAAMLDAMTTILTSAGFRVRESTNEYDPLSLEVLEPPRTEPFWWPSTAH